jgi:bifunctional UDP-N-acetylglucosamine pyrophosphorylase/glucosamine-1-phosphate N-acetyltransferase
MKAVILAAGKSTRTWPLTSKKPKALLKAANKTIIEHNLEQLDGLVEEAIIVVGFEAGQIKTLLGKKFGKIRISYAEQKEQLGTGHALLQAEKLINNGFIVMVSDDFYSKEDIKRCLKHKYCVLAKKVSRPEGFGVFLTKDGLVTDLVEKPRRFISDLANTACYVLDKKIFSYVKKIKRSERGEYELTDAVKEFARNEAVRLEEVKGYWIPVPFPWSLLEANEFFLKKIKGKIEGTIKKGATVKGEVIVGRGTVIKSGSYIEGPVTIGENCSIGPNCYLRNCVAIGNNCKIGNAVEIKNSIIMDNTKVPHLSYIGDSVIGENVNLGAGTITANLRHDDKAVKSLVKGEMVDTGRRKLGAIIGDNAKTGINSALMPGVKIGFSSAVGPSATIFKDVADNAFAYTKFDNKEKKNH